MRQAGGTDDLIAALTAGGDPEAEPPRLRRLVYFARKLTLLPNSLSRRDADDLRAAGLTDLEILQAVQVTAYYNYVNRTANALGVELETDAE